MAEAIKMPQLSDTMDSGKILSWSVAEGQLVKRGDILAEVETDKANLEIECFVPGTVLQIVTQAGTNAKVGEVIAYIGEAGETVANGSANVTSSSPASAPADTAPALEASPGIPETQATTMNTTKDYSSGERVKASPLARKIAEQNNVDLSTVNGSGPDGRIIKKDLEKLLSYANQDVVPNNPSAPQPHMEEAPVRQVTVGTGTLTPFSKMRATIASRMQKAVIEAPHFYTTCSIDMQAALDFRAQCKEHADLKSISINHLIIKATAYALKNEPSVNCSVKDDQLYSPAQINIGIITAVEDGLLIPVVKEVDKLSLKDLAFEARAAIDRARAGRPNSTDLSGGTFSISNMGMFDVESFTAIINPGQGAVLAVSSVIETPVVKNGQLTIGQIMKVTLSVDHRIIDGTMSGRFLKHFKAALEAPALMVL